jgi:hypothetical protein
VTAQFSLTTGQWTLLAGGQVLQVFQLSNTVQGSFFAQLQGGQNVSTGTNQVGVSVGTQWQWQPLDFFAVVGQVGGGPTAQASGPSSVDLGFTISIQVMK